MTNYPGNSNKPKETQKKNIKPAVKKRTRTKKKGFFSRWANMLIVDGARDNALEELIIPTIDNAIISIVGYFFGGKKASSSSSKTPYRQAYQERDTHPINKTGLAKSFTYDDILFDDRNDAEAVIEGMDECIKQYGIVSVLDMYDLANIPLNGNYTARNYGWTNIRAARIIRMSDGYLLKMPRPMPIDHN